MELFASLIDQLAAVRQLIGEVSETDSIPERVCKLTDDEVVSVLETATSVMHSIERFQLAASGVVGQRSTRATGHSGIAQSRGHRNSTSFVQQITGSSRAQAAREVRVGQSLIESVAGGLSAGPDGQVRPGQARGFALGVPASEVAPWHAPLGHALLAGSLTSSQHDAIKQGLGEPPTPPAVGGADAGFDSDRGAGSGDTDDTATVPTVTDLQREAAAIAEAWRLAAEELILEAPRRTVEELRQAAQSVRDLLDPAGAEHRYLARYEARSFRMWRDAEGTHHAAFTLDDESAAWMRGLINSALRPRTGGPRFVDPTEKTQAEELRDDPRTNDQLTHDLIMDVLRSGTLATAEQVFGTRQAGVRIVQVVDTGRPDRTFFEDDSTVLPPWAAGRETCNSGSVPISVDHRGNPLNVGREQRLFTSKQRIALSLRDGGCRWLNCDRQASYCEAHHIDEWAGGGQTDIERGVLLCRFHHMQLHNGGWRITRTGDGPFFLHSSTGETIELAPRTARTLAWNLGNLPPLSVSFRPQLSPAGAGTAPKVSARPVSAPAGSAPADSTPTPAPAPAVSAPPTWLGDTPRPSRPARQTRPPESLAAPPSLDNLW